MTINKVFVLALFLALTVLFTGVAIAGGSVYYGPDGSDYGGCGSGTPCRSYGYAASRACQLSDSDNVGGFYGIYHTNYGYVGFCDKSGGSGVEPGPTPPGIPYDLDGILWSTLAMVVAGFVMGSITLRRR